jgi:hypothetical protein
MYQTLTYLHSLSRWLVLISLIYAIYRAYKGYATHSEFTKTDNSVRHWTATIAHLQLMIGIILYVKSPVVSYFWKNITETIHNMDVFFFGLYHITLMLTAIVFITIGSALAKRRTTDKEKFKTQLIWFSIALFLIFIAIPWPFSPFTNRPYLR